MRVVRTILAFAIAISVAMLPVGASAAGHAMSPDDTQHGMQMPAQTDMSMDDCCPEDMKGTTSQGAVDKCGMGFCCGGATIALGDAGEVIFRFVSVTSADIDIPADQVLSARGSSPPFRPPRI